MTNRPLFLAFFLFLSFQLCAQEVPVKQIDKDTYSFSTKDMVLIEDIELEGPSYHLSDGPYRFTIRAKDENGAHDQSVNGKFVFNINGQRKEVQFTNGAAAVEHQLEKENLLVVELANTNVKESMRITRVSSTPGIIGVLVFLLLTFLFRHQLARWFRKIFGKEDR